MTSPLQRASAACPTCETCEANSGCGDRWHAPIWILARNCMEADQVAREHELRPSQWRLVTGINLRGTRGITVWKTPCWWHGRDTRDCQEIEHGLNRSGAVVVEVNCPGGER